MRAAMPGARRLARRVRRAAARRLPGPERDDQQRAARAALGALQRRDAARCAARRRRPTSARCCPIAGPASGSTRWSCAGAGRPDFAAILSLKDYPDATSPGLLDRDAAAAVRAGRDRELRPAGAPDRARADGPGAAPAALGRRGSDGRARRDARGARRARHRLDRVRRSPPDRAGARARPRPARRGDRLGRRRAGRRRRDRGARGHQPRAGVLGPVPRQRGLPGAPGDDLDRQHGQLRLARTASRSARRPATTGATRWRCSRPPARRRSSSTSTTATSATSRSSARRARARRW